MNENIVAIAITHKHTFTMHILRNCVIENLKLNLKLRLLATSAKATDVMTEYIHTWEYIVHSAKK